MTISHAAFSTTKAYRSYEEPTTSSPRSYGWLTEFVQGWHDFQTKGRDYQLDVMAVGMAFVAFVMIVGGIITSAATGPHYAGTASPTYKYAPAKAGGMILDRAPAPRVELRDSLHVSAVPPIGGAHTSTGTADVPPVEPVKPMPDWATPECLDRLAGVIQGEVGIIQNHQAWEFVAKNLENDLNKCSFVTVWKGNGDGTASDTHVYDFEKRWYGRTPSEEIRPEFYATAKMVLLGSPALDTYKTCTYVDNYEGSIKRVPKTVVTIGDSSNLTSHTVYGSGCQ